MHVGTGGTSNLNVHRNSKVCKDSQQARQLVQPQANSLLNFFSRKPSQETTNTTRSLLPATVGLPLPQPVQGQPPTPSVDPPGADLLIEKANDGPEPCPNALRLLKSLKESMELIPKDVPLAQPNHPLAVFFGNPVGSEGLDYDDDWDSEEVLNPKMKAAFGWNQDGLEMGYARRGEFGLDGFVKFIGYFIHQRSLNGALLETKITALIETIRNQ